MSTVEPGAGDLPVSSRLEERRILDALSDAVIVASDDNTIVDANAAVEQLLGWTRDQLVGRPLTTIIPPRLHAAHAEGFGRYVLTGEARLIGQPVRVPAQRADGAEAPVELNLGEIDDGGARRIVGVLRDVSHTVELERQVAMSEYFRATTEVAVLLGLSGRAHSLDDAAPLVLAAVGESLGWQMGSMWLVDRRTEVLRCTSTWHAPGFEGELFEQLSRAWTFRRGEGLPGMVWETGEPSWLSDFSTQRYPRSAAAAKQGLQGGFAFPIIASGEVVGVMEFFLCAASTPDPDLIGVVSTIGQQVGMFIDRSWAEVELMASREKFAELTRVLQTTLLPPPLPDITGLDLGARYQPASDDVDVGGDFYDLFRTRGTTWAMVVGDVCGRGAEAATLTAVARYTLRTASLGARRPSRMLATLNEVVFRSGEDERFLTAAVLTVRPRDGRITLALGGHPQPVLLSLEGSASLVGTPGMLLGIGERSEIPDIDFALRPGEALILYTDGVIEARRQGEQFGTERLLAAVEAAAGLDADGIAGSLLDTVGRFQGTVGDDDIAILVLRRPPR